jgi:hypothetical protein
LRSSIYWELHKNNIDNSRKIRVTKDSALNPTPLHLDRPFTWIFTARCGENSLKRWGAIPAPDFGAHVYRLTPPGLSMGIVDIESLPYTPDTMLLKMLGRSASAKQAFADILNLEPNLELRNDIISVSLKHCIYLEKFRAELSAEALSFMTYVKEVEEAYQEWVQATRAEGKLEGMIKSAQTMVRAKFGSNALTALVIDRLNELTESQLDEFTSKIFEWENSSQMLDWLADPVDR